MAPIAYNLNIKSQINKTSFRYE